MAEAKNSRPKDNQDGGKSQMEAAKFRSVLPHEPLPKQGYGYIHIQGAFEPKQKQRPNSNVQDDTAENDTEVVYYWKTPSQLHDALFDILSNKYQGFNFPAPVLAVEVLDPSPPFTKVRLAFSSPRVAMEVVLAWKSQNHSPKQFFSASVDHPENGDDNSLIRNSNTLLTFGSHAFQPTLITTDVLPPDSTCWNRSNPPKFRRLLAREGDDDDPSRLDKERAETRFVFMTGLLENPTPPPQSFWNHSQQVIAAIRSVVNDYDTSGLGVEVFVSHKKMAHSCHIGMRSAEDAKRLIHELQGKQCEWTWTTSTSHDQTESVSSGTLFLDYVAITQQSLAISKARTDGKGDSIDLRGEPSRPECTSTTDDVVVPGLILIPDFLTIAEEEVIMAVLTGPQAPWAPSQTTISQTGFVKRLVQHYGYVFDYETADVLRCRTNQGADCPPLPAIPAVAESPIPPQALENLSRQCTDDCRGWELFGCIIERTRQHEFGIEEMDDKGDERKKKTSFPDLNQVTVNHYKPGEGIGSHVDTPPAFSDGLISISLNGGIVMEFRNVGNLALKKLLYLPPRSLVLMSGPARYEWEHMIVTRRTDTVNGHVLPRKLRVSLTLRTAITLDDPPTPLPIVESRQFPPVWGGGGSSGAGAGPTSFTKDAKGSDKEKRLAALITPSTERDHVHAVYDAIATQWHHTRGKRGVLWPGATQFLQRLPVGSVVADVGCGDGKYFPAVWEAGSYVIGTDISLPLLQKCMSFSAFMGSQDADAVTMSVPDVCKVSPHRAYLRDRPATAVADCMSVPLRSKSCDAAICIAVMHHLSTEERRLRCIEELVRIVRVGGTINIQAWAIEQANDSRRRFAAQDVFVPFNAQPKYLDKVQRDDSKLPLELSTVSSNGLGQTSATTTTPTNNNKATENKSIAQVYSEAYKNADFDEKKGLVVFQRYCHVYQKGELEALVSRVANVALVESGYENGNHFVILEVVAG